MEVLFRRGAIRSPRRGHPDQSLTTADRAELSTTRIARLERRLAAAWSAEPHGGGEAMADYDLIVRNARIVTAEHQDEDDIAVKDGGIAAWAAT